MILSAGHAAWAQGASRASIVADFYSDMVFAEQNAGQKLPVGNLCKVATVAVVLDWARATGANLGQMMEAPPSVTALAGGNALGLQPGERLTMRDGICALLMASDNAAAETLAQHVGLDVQRRRGQGGHPIGVFVREMNNLCAKQGMKKTHFANPHGLDMRSRSYSTAADLVRLTKYALQQPGFSFYTSNRERRVSIQGPRGSRSVTVRNLNELLGQFGVDGLTTGQTPTSGSCSIVTSRKPDVVNRLPGNRSQIFKRRLVAVVIGAQDRAGAASGLIDYGWRQFEGWNQAGRPAGRKGSTLSSY